MKNSTLVEEALNYLSLDDEDKNNYRNPDNDSRGAWVSTDFGAQGYRPNQMYTITTPGGVDYTPSEGRCWKNTEDKFKQLLTEGRMWFGKDGCGVPRKKLYLFEREGKSTWTWWNKNEVGHTQEATQNLTALLGKKTIFDYPKPVRFIKRMIEISTNINSTTLDFFSGSATTAHAVMQLNAEDGGNRKYIMVQLPEPTDEKSEAHKAGYKTICEIGKERIRRAGDKIVSQLKEKQTGQKTLMDDEGQVNPDELDIGFKVFKLDSSNLKKWNPDYDDLKNTLESMITNIVDGRSEEDLLYEIMLKFGIDLTYPIETESVNDKNVYNIGNGALFICLDKNITTEVATFIASKKDAINPEVTRVVFRDNGFTSDADKTNVVHILKNSGIEEIMSV